MIKRYTFDGLRKQLTRSLSITKSICALVMSVALALCLSTGLKAQVFTNGNLSTGALNSAGTLAPSGYTWSELQGTNTTLGSLATSGSFRLADNFAVTCGPWNINKFVLYGYVVASGSNPINDVRFAVYNGDPAAGGTIIFGDLNTNRFSTSSTSFVYRIANGSSDLSRQVWRIEVNIPALTPLANLANGNYWIVYSLGNTAAPATSTQTPTSTVVGTTTQPGNNAKQFNISTSTWANLTDVGGAQDIPFLVEYTTSACSGTPAPGNTLTSAVGSICASVPFTLSVQNPVCGSGITYQWQYSTNGGALWNNISGATNSTLSTTYSNIGISPSSPSIQFRVQASCAASGQSGTSTAVIMSQSALSACYCTPPSTDCNFSGSPDRIENVTFAGINNNSTCSLNGYGDFTGLTPGSALSGIGNSISVTCSNGGNEYVGVWIDYNQNGVFESNEFTNLGLSVLAGSVRIASGTINIPLTALTGTTRMRVRMNFSAAITGGQACVALNQFGETEDYLVNITPATACSGAPVLGTLSSSPAAVCANAPYTVTLSNAGSLISQTGFVYQWQSSPDNVTYTNIAGANSASYNGSQIAATWYRLLVTCTASGQTTTSAPVQVTMNPLTQCYCTPGQTTSNDDDVINNVTFAGINNNSGNSAPTGYSNYTNTVWPAPLNTNYGIAYRGVNNPISITVPNSPWTEYVAAWIDYNQNGVFDTDEYTFIGISPGGAVLTNNITIPVTAQLGITRMRVRIRFNTNLNPGDACIGYTFGETEDYLIDIRDQVVCGGVPVIGTPVASTATVCPGEEVTVTVSNASILSGTVGLSLQWQSAPTAGGPWTNIGGATSVTYTTTIAATTFYRLQASCGASNATSGSISVGLTPPSGCYCSSAPTSSNFSDITNVTLSTLNNSSDCSSNAPGPGSVPNRYSNYTAGTGAPAAPIIYSGTSNPFSVSVATCGTSNVGTAIAIWIDYNQDGVFAEPAEKVYSSTAVSSSFPRTENGNITIPSTATTGITRMRIVNANTSSPQPCGNYSNGETEDYLVDIRFAPSCNNTFSPNITASANPVCPFVPFTLTVTNATGISGLTYQWEISTNGTTWSDIGGATSATLNTSQSVVTYYRARVLCGPSATTTYSNVIQVNMENSANCYCIPAPASNCTNDYISNVNFGGINNNSLCSSGAYTNYSASVTAGTITKGSANPISVSTLTASSGTKFVGVWIDYNQNGAFETTEYNSLGSTPGGAALNGSIIVPATANNGITRMRVRVRRTNALNGTDACLSYTNGETEDYSVNIVDCSPAEIETQPQNAFVSCGTNGSFSVTASASSTIFYQWLVRTSSTAPWTVVTNTGNYTGATTATLNISAPPLSFNGYEYAVTLTSSCLVPDTSDAAVLTVNPAGSTIIINQPVNASVNCGSSTSFTYTVSTGASPVYQWQFRPNASSPWTNVVNNAVFSGATTTTLSIAGATNALNGYQFRAYIGSACSSSDTTNAATLTVTPITLGLSIVSNAPSNTICNGSSVTFTATPVYTGSLTIGYRWFIDNIATANAASSGTTINVASTAQLAVGMVVSVFSGTGAFAASTSIVSITNATSFVVSAAPTVALANGSVISAYIPSEISSTFTTSNLANGNQVRCRALVNDGSLCTTPNPAFSNTVTMIVTPNTTTTVVLSTPNTTICANDNAVFTATPTNPGANPQYQFFIGNTSVQGPGSSNTYNTSSLTNGQIVKVRMTSNANNCPAPNPARDSVTMVVNPTFPVSVSLAADPGGSGPTINICSGIPITFTATGTNAGTSPVYSFRKNGSVVQTGSSNTYITSTLVNGDIIDVVLNSSIATCAPGNPDTSSTLTVNITQQVATVTLSTNPLNACAGALVTYTATETNGGSTPVFQFYVNGNPVANSGNSYTYVPSEGDSVSVEMASSLPCALPNPATAFIIQTLVDAPSSLITISNQTCASNSATLDAGGNAGSGTISGYQWQSGTTINGPWTNIVGATSSTYFTATAGFYAVLVTNSLGCSNTVSGFNLTLPQTLSPMSGIYTIGAVTAVANAASSGVTINVASTANLSVGAIVSVTSGTGAFAANTIITAINNATSFTVSQTPTTALQNGAVVAGATCTNYISFKSAFDDLNTRTIIGNSTFNVSAGFVETLTTRLDLGSAALNPTVAGRTIVFQKVGVGTNPQINAYTGTGLPASASPAVPDGMIALVGVDNVTFDGITLNDGNTVSPTTMMEYGIGFFKRLITDGAQNNTIKNCKISLNRNNNSAAGTVFPEGSIGILLNNSLVTTPNVGFGGGGGVNGANANNKFYNDTIINCNQGVVLNGFAAASPYTDGDVNNDFGGATSATGNWVLNFGGATGATLQANGVRIINQWNANISNNIINNNIGTGANHTALMRGIYGQSGAQASITINNNTITLQSAGIIGAAGCYAIDNTVGSGALGFGNTVTISNNIITGTYTSAAAPFWSIFNAAICPTLNINGNTIQNTTYSGASEWRGIYNNASGCQNVNINNNTFSNNSLTTSLATTTLIYSVAVTGAPNPTATVSGNILTGNVRNSTAVAGSSELINLQASAGAAFNIENNSITNNVVNVTGAVANAFNFRMMRFNICQNSNINNNTIVNNGVNVNITGGTGAMLIEGISTVGNVGVENIAGNTIRRLFVNSTASGTSTGTHTVTGIFSTGGATLGSKNIGNNQIDTLFARNNFNARIVGIQNTFGVNVNVFKNRISALWPGQSTTLNISYAEGIRMNANSATTTVNTISNNMISLDQSLTTGIANVSTGVINSTVDALRGIDFTNASANATHKVYNNSIRLAGTGVTNFGSAAIFATAIATGTSGNLDMRNNILVNLCTYKGTGLVAAYKRSLVNTFSNYATTSNNNVFFVTDGTNQKVVYDATTGYTLAAFQALAGISPRETNSILLSPAFINESDLHIQSCDGTSSQIDGNGDAGTGLTDDIDNEIRGATPDRGADEFTASSFGGSVNANTTVCSGTNSGTLTLVSFTGSIVRWESSIDSITWTPIANTTTSQAYSNLTVKTWYRAVVSSASCGGSEANSLPASVSINALPTISLTSGGASAAVASVCVGANVQLFGTATAAFANPWVSATTAVGTISSTGLAVGVTVGSTVITYTNTNGCQKSLTLTVNPSPTISGSSNSVCVSATLALTGSGTAAAVNPWVSNNTAVATVSNAGLVSGVTAGNCSITYTNSNGCVSLPYAITVNPRPTITGSGSLCVGNAVTLSGTPTAAASNPWVSSNTAVVTINGSGFVTPIAVGTATITYTNQNTCTNTLNVTVNASPSITGTPVVCVGATVTLSGSGTASASTPWSSSNTAIATVSNAGLVTGVAAGTCNITYTNSNGCFKTVVFTVNPAPTAYSVTGGGAYCIGGTGVTIGLANSQSGVNYQLVFSPSTNIGSPVAGNSSALDFGLQTTAGTYLIKGTNTATNCTGNMSNTVLITINPLPTITGSFTLCQGNSTTLSGNGTPAAVNPWLSADPSVATITSGGLINALAVGTTTISYTNSNGCRKDSVLTVTTPSVSGTASGDNTVCAGINTSAISLSGQTGSIQWQSSTDNITFNNIGGATTTTYNATNLNVTTYYRAVVTNSGGCTPVISNVVTITVNPAPTAFAVTGGGSYCAGGNGVAIGLSGSQSGVTYNLLLGATTVGTANGTGSALSFGSFTGAGTYTVQAVNNTTTCPATMTGNAGVTINPRPSANITQAGPINFCVTASTTLTTSTNAASPQYQWYQDGVAIGGATNATYTVSAAGTSVYTVQITNTANSCVSIRSQGVIVTGNSAPTNVAVSPASTEVCPSVNTNLTASSDPVTVNAIALLEDFNGTSSASWTITNDVTSPAAANWTFVTAPFNNTTGSATFSAFTTNDAGKFAIAEADAAPGQTTNTQLISPAFSLANYTSASLNFEHALNSSVGTDNIVQVDISNDGGTNWSLLRDYRGQTAGVITNNSQTTANDNISLSTFLGQSNLKIRYRYESTSGRYWIIDNIRVSGVRENVTNYTWSPATALSATSGASVIANPASTITYTVTATATNCSANSTATITTTPNPVITTQPATPAAVCSGDGTVSLSVIASGSNLVYIWRKDGANLSNNTVVSGQGTATITLTNPTVTDAGTYDVLVSGVCGINVTSGTAVVSITAPGTWLGLSTVWTDAANWCGGVPTSTTNVTIPVSANYPVITAQLPVCNNLTLVAGASLTVQGKLAIYGSISNAGTFIAKDGTIEMAGSTGQTIPSGVFQNNNLRNLIIANSSVTLGGNLNLLNKLSFSGSNRTFATAGFLTLKSSDTLTASVGDLTNNNTTSGNQITGNVTTERFVSSRRAWRLLSMPTQHNFQSIKQSWQEGATGNTQNPAPGFGIQITSNRPSWIADGFDTFSVAGPSIKVYSAQTNLWDGIPSTNINFEAGKAYMTFIRGNRSVTQISQAPTTTVLREKGALITGTYTIPSIGTAGSQFIAVGNPFAAAIDFSKLGRTNLQSLYYLWDPLLGTFGGYQTCLVDAGGNVSNTPGGGSYTAGNFAIQSGQGFFVRTTTAAGSLSFPENAKVDGSVLVTRSVNTSSMIRTNLYQLQSGTPVLYDGVMNRFDDAFVSGIDQDDAEKLGNFNENLGVVRDGKTLAIESRPMPVATDTIQYRLGQVRMTNYRFVLQTQGMSQAGTQAYLEDLFMQTSTPVEMNGETTYDFSINNTPASYAANRFRLVFRPLAPVPVTYTDVKAEKDEKRVRVSWTVENEINIARYQLEKSIDGTSFVGVGLQPATGSHAYFGYDENPVKGNNYYRIKAYGTDGSVMISRVVRVLYEGTPMITIQPNPVQADGIMQVYMTDMVAGRYQAVLIDASGRQVYRSTINYSGLNQVYRLVPKQKMAQGVYQLILTGPEGQKTTVKVLYESH